MGLLEDFKNRKIIREMSDKGGIKYYYPKVVAFFKKKRGDEYVDHRVYSSDPLHMSFRIVYPIDYSKREFRKVHIHLFLKYSPDILFINATDSTESDDYDYSSFDESFSWTITRSCNQDEVLERIGKELCI